MNIRSRGFALASVLLLCVILLMLMVSLHLTVGGRLASSQFQSRSVKALFVAEGGVAESLVALENNLSWTGVTKKPLGEGSYTVSFDASTPPRQRSIMNLMGTTAVDSYRGTGTVPAQTALLIVEAEVAGVKRTLEVLVNRGTAGGPFTGAGLQSSGSVSMEGNVLINGVKSLDDATAIAAGIHSAFASSNPNLVTWTGVAGETATITGKVSAVGSDAGAIQMSGATILGGTQTGAGALAFPTHNIPATVSSKSASPAPVINGAGVTTLNGGEYYHSGDLTLNGGDLVMKGAKLYVSGNLTINGALSGSGSVYVNGNVSFKGDAALTSRQTQSLALLAQGNVDLIGFDGTQYLNGLASGDAQLQTYLTEASDTVQDLQTLLMSDTATALLGNATVHTTLDAMRRTLGQHDGATYSGYNNNLFRKIQQKVLAQPASSQQAFLANKLDRLDKMFEGHSRLNDTDTTGAGPNQAACLADWSAGQTHMGWFDAVIDTGVTAATQLDEMNTLIQQVTYDRLGTSYFQGTIYARGSLYAANEVNVLGGVFIQGDPSNAPRVVGTKTLNPGDVYLKGGCRITAVEDQLGGTVTTPVAGDLRVQSWLGR